MKQTKTPTVRSRVVLYKKKVLGETKVTVLDKNKIDAEIQKDLKYYFEYKPNENVESNPDWLDYKAIYSRVISKN